MDELSVLRALNALHQAAIGNEDWTEALSSLARALHVEAVSLEEFSLTGGAHRMYGYSAFEPATIADYVAYFHSVNPRWNAALFCRPGKVIVDDFLASRSKRDRNEFFNWIEKVSEFTYCMGLKLHHDKDCLAALTVHRTAPERGFEPGTEGILEQIAPNLLSIYATARELDYLRDHYRSGFSALDGIKFGIGLLTPGGCLRDCNATLRRFLEESPFLSIGKGGELSSPSAPLAARLTAAMERARSGECCPLRFDDPVFGETVLRFVPPAPSGADRFRHLLLIAKGNFVEPVALAEIRAEFDLAEREAEVARQIMRGRSLDQIAKDLGITTATAKVHLRNIFVKTDTHRQAELTQLLWNTFSP